MITLRYVNLTSRPHLLSPLVLFCLALLSQVYSQNLTEHGDDPQLVLLRTLHTELGGDQWAYGYTSAVNAGAKKWLSDDLYCTWVGVICLNNSVAALTLSNFNATSVVFPNSILDLVGLRRIDISDNKIAGTIPPKLANLTSLEDLNLSANLLSGSIPQFSASLRTILLGSNRLASELPFPLPPYLIELDVQNNMLNGTIDVVWPNGVEFVNLANNLFSGSFPRSLIASTTLKTVLLGYNNFTGTIPDEVPENTSIQVFEVQHNQFSGPVPQTLFFFTTSIVAFDLSHNQLSGNVEDILNLRAMIPTTPAIVPAMDLSFNSGITSSSGDAVLAMLLQLMYNFKIIHDLNLDGIPMKSPMNPIGPPMNPNFAVGNSKHLVPDTFLLCSDVSYVGRGIGGNVYFPPTFWNYSNCECQNRFWGKAPTCQECPEGIECNSDMLQLPGGVMPVLNHTGFLLGFLECHKYKNGKSPCLPIPLYFGDHHFEHKLCEEGYEGRLCSECLCEHEECYFAADGECLRCHETKTWVIIGGAIGITACLLIFIFLKGSKIMLLLEAAIVVILLFLGIGQSYIFDVVVFFVIVQGLEILGKGDHNKKALVSIEGLAKLFLWYLQALDLLVDADFWPEQIKIVLSKLQVVNFHSSSIDCTQLVRSFSASVGKEVSKLIIVLLVPVVLSLCMIVVLTLRRAVSALKEKFFGTSNSEDPFHHEDYFGEDDLLMTEPINQDGRSKRDEPSLRSEIAAMLLFVSYATLVEVSATVFESLSCTADRFTGLKYMTDAPAVSCSSTQYHTLELIAWPVFAIWVLGLPVFFAVLLYRNRHALHDHETEHWLGLLYENYSHHCWWWEIIWILRRILLALSVSWLEDTPWKNALVSTILVGSMSLMFTFKPFKYSLENTLESAVTALLLVSWTSSFGEEGVVDVGVQWAVVAANALLWLCFIVLFAMEPAKALYRKYKKKCKIYR